MTSEALEAKKAYDREYRKRNRQRINQQQREWRARNPDMVRAQNERYWQKKAESVMTAGISSLEGAVEDEKERI
ncbi:MAG: hypothetical protein K2P73_17615 [Lachnospiraceae bacterium]|nr:hypothetical protein [Lachnospiraceae bacterium]MDE7002079.1 hypothetical protein [Lachnospiraceae bacterium]